VPTSDRAFEGAPFSMMGANSRRRDDHATGSARLRRFYDDLERVDLQPLWTQTRELMTRHPEPATLPYLWSWKTLRSLAEQAGELVLTPNWTWHDHHSSSDAPMIWFDGLDLPTVAALDAMFFEPYPVEELQPTRGHNRSARRYGGSACSRWTGPGRIRTRRCSSTGGRTPTRRWQRCWPSNRVRWPASSSSIRRPGAPRSRPSAARCTGSAPGPRRCRFATRRRVGSTIPVTNSVGLVVVPDAVSSTPP
jgi:hypothetical protein